MDDALIVDIAKHRLQRALRMRAIFFAENAGLDAAQLPVADPRLGFGDGHGPRPLGRGCADQGQFALQTGDLVLLGALPTIALALVAGIALDLLVEALDPPGTERTTERADA